MEPIVANLHSRGFTVLLAHPERSATFQRELARLGRLIELGAYTQVTSGALAGGFGNTAQRAALAFLEAGLVHVLASDSHDPRHRPPDPRLGAEVLIRRYGDVEEQLQWMTDSVPAALVAGASLPSRPPVLRPRGLRSKLKSWSAR
jgi:protein-tyrosine phosphatase